jgi:hypothetical protein
MSETAKQFPQPLGSGFFNRDHFRDLKCKKFPKEITVCQTWRPSGFPELSRLKFFNRVRFRDEKCRKLQSSFRSCLGAAFSNDPADRD